MNDTINAKEKGFCCAESMLSTEGAWSAGFCCFEHMVLHFDNGPTEKPIIRNVRCYQRIKDNLADEREMLKIGERRIANEELKKQDRLEFAKENKERQRSMNIMRSRHETPSRQTFTLAGNDLQRAIRVHRKKMQTTNQSANNSARKPSSASP